MRFELAVNRRELLGGLRRFIRNETWPSQKAVLAFDGRFFSIKAGTRLIVAHADGTWPGLAYVRSNAILALALAPPEGDPVRVECDGKRLRLASLTVFCAWQPVSTTLLSLPAAPDWVQALSMHYRGSQARADPASDAALRSEQQLARLISRAAKSLAALGITEADIRSLIEKRLSRRPADN